MKRVWSWLSEPIFCRRRFMLMLLCLFIYLFIADALERKHIPAPPLNTCAQEKVIWDAHYDQLYKKHKKVIEENVRLEEEVKIWEEVMVEEIEI